MPKVNIVLPDNSKRSFDHQPTILQLAEDIGPRLAKDTLGGIVNGELQDLRFELSDGDKVEIVTPKHEKGLEVIRHSAAHVMAQAVQELWPEVKVTIGPVIEDGYFYDFDSPFTFDPDHLGKIEKKMKEIIKRGNTVTKEVWDKKYALENFAEMDERFKVEIIDDLGEQKVSIYKQGDWYDLCRGPHVQKIGQIKAIKVLSQAGAYWRGDENKPQLQRVYATAFFSQSDLDAYLLRLEEAKKRDHRKLGKEMKLIYFTQLSPGSPFFTKKGTIIYNELTDYMRQLYRKYGYDEVISPQIYDVDLYHTSGHYDHYRENMYFTDIDKRDFSVKPMNCPGHCVLYSSELYSYKDLPVRIADFGRLHRYEKSGVIHGLTRVRSFAQDDAHVFCTMEQVQAEIESFMRMLAETYKTLGMADYEIFLATRPEKRVGGDEIWDQAEAALENALKAMNVNYKLNAGDGAFYGPKLDFNFTDAIGRKWQLCTLQLDFNMPMRFGLRYIGTDNAEHTPVMIHRAVLGSLERFIGVYTEHVAGHFPTWLTPTQTMVMNVTERAQSYCQEIQKKLFDAGVRTELDDRSEKLGFKIREAQMQRIPYMIICGDKEVEQNTISVRHHTGENFNDLKIDEFIIKIKDEIKNKNLTSFLLSNKGE